MDIICMGEMLIDFTPVKGMANTYTANPGGAPANVAVSVARNGQRAGFLGKMGNDDFGRMLINTLKADNVEILCPNLTDEATTTLAFVTLDEAGDRSFTFARKPGADLLLCEEDVSSVDYSEWNIVHAGSVSQSGAPEKDAVLLALQKAKDAGALVSFDINYRDRIWSEEDCAREVEKAMPYVDLLKISEEELVFVGGWDNIAAFMAKYDVAVVVVTRGEKGARIYFGQEIADIEAVKAQAVDTTGAGDAYWGAFLSSLLSCKITKPGDITMEKLEAAGRYGAASGALCITKSGGIPAIPFGEEIEKVVKKNRLVIP